MGKPQNRHNSAYHCVVGQVKVRKLDYQFIIIEKKEVRILFDQSKLSIMHSASASTQMPFAEWKYIFLSRSYQIYVEGPAHRQQKLFQQNFYNV